MAEDDSLPERILKNLENIISRDKRLESFSIVPERRNITNKSPILYQNHHIGLESWCVKHIYRYAYNELLSSPVRKALSKNKLPLHKMESLNHLLIGVLLINPDVSTFWAMKRELIENNVLNVEGEFLFSKVVLSHKSKSNEAFSYRKWLIKKIWSKQQHTEAVNQIITGEMYVTQMCAENSPNNYHAWSHRIWCIQTLLTKLPYECLISTIRDEVNFTHLWVEKHVSEHTGFHYRQFVFDFIKRYCHTFLYQGVLSEILSKMELSYDTDYRYFLSYLLGEPKRRLENSEVDLWMNYFCLLLNELLFVFDEINTVFPGHESLWYHRRYLINRLVHSYYEYHELSCTNFNTNLNDCYVNCNSNRNIVSSCLSSSFHNLNENGEKSPKIFKNQVSELQSSKLYSFLVKNEGRFIEDHKIFQNNTKSCLEREYASRYETWMNYVLGFEQL